MNTLDARIDGRCIRKIHDELCGAPVDENTFFCAEHGLPAVAACPSLPDAEDLTPENFGARVELIQARMALVNSLLSFCAMAQDDLHPRWQPTGRVLAHSNFATNLSFAIAALGALSHRGKQPVDPLMPYPPGCALLVALAGYLDRLRAEAERAFGGESAGVK